MTRNDIDIDKSKVKGIVQHTCIPKAQNSTTVRFQDDSFIPLS